MKSLIFFTAFFLSIGNVISQSTYTSVEYVIGLADYDTFKKNNETFKKDNKQFSSEKYSLKTESIDFYLLFDKNSSYFQEVEKLDTDFNQGMNFIKLLLSSNAIYTDSDAILVKPKLKSMSNYLIKREPINWNLTQKSKEIMGLCSYKATGSYSVLTSWGYKEINITAWYTPKIPVRWGPDVFSGLPGLILEATSSQNIVFRATKITTDVAEKLRKPKGKIITLSKYEAIMKTLKERYRG